MAEVLGGIAGVAGLFAFLVTVPEKTYSKSKSLANIVHELHSCKDDMSVIDLELQLWKDIWKWQEVQTSENAVVSQEMHELFWGPETLSSVKRWLMTIESERNYIDKFLLNKRVACLMQRSNEQGGMEEAIPETLKLKEDLPRIWRYWSGKIGGWKVAIAHTIYKGGFLKERVGEIKKTINTLRETTRSAYWKGLGAKDDTNGPVDPRSLTWTRNVFTRYNAAVEHMKAWERITEGKGEERRLVLGKPSPQVAFDDLGDGYDFDLDFVVKSSEQSYVQTVVISPQKECSMRVDSANDPTIDTAETVNIRNMLTSASKKDSLRKQYEPQFRSTATCLVRSTILLHGAPWTQDLCNCGVLLVGAEHSDTGICTFMKPGVTDNCSHNPGTEGHRFVRLARALTELGMGETISCERFEEPDELRAVLFNKLRHQTSRSYMEALQSCLDLAEHEKISQSIRPERIRRAFNEILQP